MPISVRIFSNYIILKTVQSNIGHAWVQTTSCMDCTHAMHEDALIWLCNVEEVRHDSTAQQSECIIKIVGWKRNMHGRGRGFTPQS